MLLGTSTLTSHDTRREDRLPRRRRNYGPEPIHLPEDVFRSTQDWAYLAGLFDGEGCIDTTSTQYGPVIRLRLTQTATDEVLQWMKSKIGGRIRAFLSPPKDHNIPYTWSAHGNLAFEILWCIYPYLRVKKAEALVAMQLHRAETRKGREIFNRRLKDLKPRNRAKESPCS